MKNRGEESTERDIDLLLYHIFISITSFELGVRRVRLSACSAGGSLETLLISNRKSLICRVLPCSTGSTSNFEFLLHQIQQAVE